MSEGSAPRQADLFRDTSAFVEPLVRPDSIHAVLHRECHALFPDELFADLFAAGAGRRSVAMIALNVAALVDLSHAYYASLKKDHGILINVASLLGFQPTPYLSVYGATKAFVLSFTESLWEEARGTGLRVLALSPGPMSTGFFEAAGSDSADYGAPRVSAEHVVKQALITLDRRNPPPSIVTNGRPLVVVGRFLPRWVVVRAMGALQRRARRQRSRPTQLSPPTINT